MVSLRINKVSILSNVFIINSLYSYLLIHLLVKSVSLYRERKEMYNFLKILKIRRNHETTYWNSTSYRWPLLWGP